MSIRNKAIERMASKRPQRWNELLNKDQSADLAILVGMVQNSEISTRVAFEVWEDSHPGTCKRSSFQSYIKAHR